MNPQELSGDQALAYGALASGVKLVASYPGSPSSGTVQALIDLAKIHGFYVEWSSNEKVALEMGIGVSIAGQRALVCVKSVGMNALIDPLMALNLTPVHGGLVILLGDDPGGYGSQNDQDTRPVTSLIEMPMLEPASPAEALDMMQEAFRASEKYRTVVIIRETRSFSQHVDFVPLPEISYTPTNLGISRERMRFVPVPKNAVEKHNNLHRTITLLEKWGENIPYNQIIGKGKKGILAAGFTFQKLMDVLGEEEREEVCILKLSTIYPLPPNLIATLLQRCDEIMVFEENEPYIETQVKALAYDNGSKTKILGKQSNHVSREGELFRWHIQETLVDYLAGFVPSQKYVKENEKDEIPQKKSYCNACNYDKVLDALNSAAKSLGQNPMLIGDPGCLVTVAERLDAKYALGSAIAVADGISKAGVQERAIAIFGDSSFFHTSIPALCNTAHNRSDILLVVLDNNAALTSGYQPHPGVNKDALGRTAPALSIEEVARACGIQTIFDVGPRNVFTELESTFREALSKRELCMVIVRLKTF